MLKVNGKKVCSRVVLHKNVFSKGTGLMLHKKIKDEVHVFIFSKEQVSPITMMFVFFPIDIIFLDKDKKIVEIVKNLKPWSNYVPKRKSQFVVELPAGTINKYSIKEGDAISY